MPDIFQKFQVAKAVLGPDNDADRGIAQLQTGVIYRVGLVNRTDANLSQDISQQATFFFSDAIRRHAILLNEGSVSMLLVYQLD